MRSAIHWCAAALGFWVAWLTPILTSAVPQVWYMPLTREFSFGAEPSGIAMGLFGQLLFAYVTAAAFGGAATLLTRGREIDRRHLLVAVSLCAVLLCVVTAFYAVEMWGRIPH